MAGRKYRWDYIWKTFLDTNEPWGRFFLKRIVPKAYADYDVDFDTAELTSEEQEQSFGGEVRIADKIIQIVVNEQEQRLHIEFEAKMAKDIALRSFKYSLARAKEVNSSHREESYELPDSVIVSVHPSERDTINSKLLTLSVNKYMIQIKYPIVRGYEVVPEVLDMMVAPNVEQFLKAQNKLIVQLPDFSYNLESVERFRKACILLAFDRTYQEGLEESEVEKASKKIWWDPRPAKDVWFEQGMEKAINNLMRNTGCTREQAEKLLSGESSSDNTSVGRLKL